MFNGKVADNRIDKGGFSGSRRTRDEHAGLDFVMIHTCGIDEGCNKIKNGFALRFAASNWYMCIVASRANQATYTSVKGQQMDWWCRRWRCNGER
jgi:hypothetical protein